MPEISVIIPVYNAEKYLAECLQSVLNQSLPDLEVICINDGSTDHSVQVLKTFQQKDSRIIIIDQPNQGVSAARNAGLKIASGKYIGFVDADDSIETDYFNRLYKLASESSADAVYSRKSPEDDFGRFPCLPSGEEIQRTLLPVYLREDSMNAVWNKIYRSSIIRDKGIVFPVGTTHGEDAHFNISFLMHAQKIAFLDSQGYYYREVDGSATKNIAVHDYLKRIIEVYETDWTPIIGNVLDPNEIMKLKKIRMANAVISLVYIYGNRGNSFTDRQRFLKLREIVTKLQIQEVFGDAETEAAVELRGYSQHIYKGIRKQNVILLYLLTQYSYYRNR